jgi:GT2 family glycosyltransferase
VSPPSDRSQAFPKVSVVIVNYNSGAYLARCLASLAAGCAGLPWEAVVVDNGSTDGSAASCEGCEGRVRFIHTDSNLGFACAANIGVRATSAPYVLFLNPDARLTPAAITPLAGELETHSDTAVVAPLILNEDGTPQGNARGDPSMMTGLLGRASLIRRLLPSFPGVGRNVVSPGNRSEQRVPVDWVSGACCLVRRQAFDHVGGFDEGYFLYWEDADLCRRIRQRGGRIFFRPDRDAVVIHTIGRSSQGVSGQAWSAFHESAYRYYATHVAPGQFNPMRWAAWLLLKARAAILNPDSRYPVSPANTQEPR